MVPGVPEEFTATGDIHASAQLTFHGFALTAAGAAAVATIRQGGAGGTVVLVIKAAIESTTVVQIPSTVRAPHLTLSGAGASFTAFK